MPLADENTKQLSLSYIAGVNAIGIIMLKNHFAGSTKGKQDKSKIQHLSSWVYTQKWKYAIKRPEQEI